MFNNKDGQFKTHGFFSLAKLQFFQLRHNHIFVQILCDSLKESTIYMYKKNFVPVLFSLFPPSVLRA